MRVVEAIRYGGPEVLALRELPTPEPAPGQVRVRVEACGINYIDVYHRTGLYPSQQPVRLGLEGAGRVEALGAGVGGVQVGDHVAWSDVAGSYASHVCAPAERLVPVPAGVSSEAAAAAMLQGMTAHYLCHDTHAVAAGDTCLVHAAAGGVGLLLCQMIRLRGGRVFGTVSTPEKAALAVAAGAEVAILYSEQDFVREVKALTAGRGVRVVYDSVGKDTFERSLQCLSPRGLLVLFGQSSGPVSPIDPQLLARGGSLFLTRPTLFHYVATPEALRARAGAVLALLARGELDLRIDHRLPLARAGEGHRLLEARATSGKLLLLP